MEQLYQICDVGNCRCCCSFDFNGFILIVNFIMKIVSVTEDLNIENRIAITPDIAKKYISNGFKVSLIKDYGKHLGFTNEEFEKNGVTIENDEKNLLLSADIILQLNLLSDEKLSNIKEN